MPRLPVYGAIGAIIWSGYEGLYKQILVPRYTTQREMERNFEARKQETGRIFRRMAVLRETIRLTPPETTAEKLYLFAEAQLLKRDITALTPKQESQKGKGRLLHGVDRIIASSCTGLRFRDEPLRMKEKAFSFVAFCSYIVCFRVILPVWTFLSGMSQSVERNRSRGEVDCDIRAFSRVAKWILVNCLDTVPELKVYMNDERIVVNPMTTIESGASVEVSDEDQRGERLSPLLSVSVGSWLDELVIYGSLSDLFTTPTPTTNSSHRMNILKGHQLVGIRSFADLKIVRDDVFSGTLFADVPKLSDTSSSASWGSLLGVRYIQSIPLLDDLVKYSLSQSGQQSNKRQDFDVDDLIDDYGIEGEEGVQTPLCSVPVAVMLAMRKVPALIGYPLCPRFITRVHKEEEEVSVKEQLLLSRSGYVAGTNHAIRIVPTNGRIPQHALVDTKDVEAAITATALDHHDRHKRKRSSSPLPSDIDEGRGIGDVISDTIRGILATYCLFPDKPQEDSSDSNTRTLDEATMAWWESPLAAIPLLDSLFCATLPDTAIVRKQTNAEKEEDLLLRTYRKLEMDNGKLRHKKRQKVSEGNTEEKNEEGEEVGERGGVPFNLMTRTNRENAPLAEDSTILKRLFSDTHVFYRPSLPLLHFSSIFGVYGGSSVYENRYSSVLDEVMKTDDASRAQLLFGQLRHDVERAMKLEQNASSKTDKNAVTNEIQKKKKKKGDDEEHVRVLHARMLFGDLALKDLVEETSWPQGTFVRPERRRVQFVVSCAESGGVNDDVEFQAEFLKMVKAVHAPLE